MELKSALEKLKKSTEFLEWSKENTNNFFSYAFQIPEENKEDWQLGFYQKSTDKMTTFIVGATLITIRKDEEIFKKPDMELIPIDVKKVKVSFNKISKKAINFQKENYPKELISKTIAILQNLKECGDHWNITYITHSFNALNIKVNAENGEVISHSLDNFMDFISSKNKKE
ncbi:hypothetical protein HYX01_04390 [Candidatus Woesearchaeota archaeon]|nr:hypothetical protein [Candidatus Woesearchaeota archaeon]